MWRRMTSRSWWRIARRAFVGEDGEERFHVGNLAAEGGWRRKRDWRSRLSPGFAFHGTRDDVVDEHATVDEIDFRAVSGKRFAVEKPNRGIARTTGTPIFSKALFQNFKFAPGGDFAPIDDGDLRALGCYRPNRVAS